MSTYLVLHNETWIIGKLLDFKFDEKHKLNYPYKVFIYVKLLYL